MSESVSKMAGCPNPSPILPVFVSSYNWLFVYQCNLTFLFIVKFVGWVLCCNDKVMIKHLGGFTLVDAQCRSGTLGPLRPGREKVSEVLGT